MNFQQLWPRKYIFEPDRLDQGLIWRQPAVYEQPLLDNDDKDEDKTISDKVLNERNKRWSIFQNIFTNGGRVYDRQKVSFGKNCVILKIFYFLSFSGSEFDG